MKRLGVIFGILVLVVVVGLLVNDLRSRWVQVKVRSADQRVTSLRTNEFLLSAYATIVLDMRRNGVLVPMLDQYGQEVIYPEIVSVHLTDKMRSELLGLLVISSSASLRESVFVCALG